MSKVAFILPAIGKKSGQKYIKTWQMMEPLTISTLKALTPNEIQTEFYDDRIESVNYDTDADLIAMTTEVYTARRAYDMAAKFRAKGKTVVFGGYHTTLNPQEAARHADALVIGNAENAWPALLADHAAGRLKKEYRGDCAYSSVLPDRSIFKGKKYSAAGVVETGRGCNFACEFCAISAFHGAKYHRRPVEQIVAEIVEAKKAGKKLFFFADDNIVADQAHALELFKAITPLKILWSGQGSLTMARNDELLYWMRKSGCTVILIGYESLDEDNLAQMKKQWTSRLGETEELTAKIHKAGLNIYATFVFGFDHDTEGLFERTRKFAEKAGFYFAAFNHLLPMPGTPLHQRLSQEGRLDDPAWWLTPGYQYGKLVFNPKLLSGEAVSELCRTTRNKFYRLSSIFKRGFLALIRHPNPLLFVYFFYLNFQLGAEVDQKMDLPIGQNLDESIK
jgi:radical SAM superfamily enzyme YgiQ (UPF0313 family)